MARISLGFKELRDLLMGKEVTTGGPNHIVLNDIGWPAILGALSQALAMAGVQAAMEHREDWQIADRLAAVDRNVPINTRLSPEEGASIQLEARRIITVFLKTMMGKGKPVGPEGLNMMPMQLPDMLNLMWIHGFSNGHDYCKEFGSLTELDMSFPDLTEADLQKKENLQDGEPQ